jgi:hypothetical protein
MALSPQGLGVQGSTGVFGGIGEHPPL